VVHEGWATVPQTCNTKQRWITNGVLSPTAPGYSGDDSFAKLPPAMAVP
jgi:hypothetical protein